ncbi:class I SAM-dependent methyltransferase [Pseudarthrobacter sp. J64]|uniref:class I SAM-dependent methyltransferase n=1 Tax=Pseudarthrobacter sp. J64 TaxID=3116485 RepID=UPI002E811AA4|nr:class I SAM-dependent methyltransferase [Pseudarthrobacter sp. J64]MEE2569132.1 class I SAM-dependent methyltransferase [Pseudarthrobacter sp. J64]
MLKRRDGATREQMDNPDCDPEKLRRTYEQFPLVNRAFAGWSGIYVKYLRPLLSPGRPTSLLDLGCGGGDVAGYLAGRARKDGLRLLVTGADPDPRAMDFAGSRPASPGVSFRRAYGSDLVAEGAAFDVVISNHVLHHLDPPEFQDFLRESKQLSTRLVLHNDLRRNPVAYMLFSVAALPLRGSFIREDGLTSIRRSYTPAELSAVAPPSWKVVPVRPFRQLLIHEGNPQAADD